MPPKGETLGPTSDEVLVRDFGRKLWLLCLIHKAIVAERTSYTATPLFDEDHMPEPVLEWFGESFFSSLPGSVILESRRDVEAALESLLNSNEYPNFPRIPAPNLPIRQSVLNRRFAFNLNKTDYASAPRNKNLKPVVASYFALDGDQSVPVHVLYRCARGFLMIPEGVDAKFERANEEPATQFAVAKAFRPEDFGLFERWTPDTTRFRDSSEAVAFEMRQKSAQRVYWAFCGKRERRKDGSICYGHEFEEFRNAALAYYCAEESELCKPEVVVHLFPEAKRNPVKGRPTLNGEVAMCLGVGHTDFGNSSLSLKMDLPAGMLSVRGALDLDGRDDTLSIRQLRVELKTPEPRDGVQLASFIDEPADLVPDGVGYVPGQTVVLELHGNDTDALKRTFRTWMPALEVVSVIRPFQMDFAVDAPLAGMDLMAEAECGPAGNQGRSAKEVLKRYLSSFIPLEQKDWEALRKVPVIRNGIFDVNAESVRSRGK